MKNFATLFIVAVIVCGAIADPLLHHKEKEEPIEAIKGITLLLTGIRNIIDHVIRCVLETIIKGLLGLITIIVPGSTPIDIAHLVSELLCLKKASLVEVLRVVLNCIGVNGDLVLAIVPVGILNTRIGISHLIAKLKILAHGKTSLPLSVLLSALGEYVVQIKAVKL